MSAPSSAAPPKAMPPVSATWPQALDRAFVALIFDWDGTAVEDRETHPAALIACLERLLSGGLKAAVITGTDFEKVDTQLARHLSPAAKRNLLVCTNRGSEVYAFGDEGTPLVTHFRASTAAEEEALDGTVKALREYLEGVGVPCETVSDRLNRRKLDLIPLPEWRAPKKAELPLLLEAVQKRLTRAGVIGGVASLMPQARLFCERHGLKHAKITSDVKHIEIGLTDKSDSLRWLEKRLCRAGGIAPSSIVIFGDEFGSVGNLPGSDSLMRVPGMEAAAYVSVGAEPNGVPEWVISLHGGPGRFVGFLESLAREQTTRFEESREWKIEQEGFDPGQARTLETLFCLGNGYLGVRGALVMPLPTSQPDLFIAGVFGPDPKSRPEASLAPGAREQAVVMPAFPSPFQIAITVAGSPLRVGDPAMRSHERSLDLLTGALTESFIFSDEIGRTTRVKSHRVTSLSDPHLCLHDLEIVCKNHSSEIVVETASVSEEALTGYPDVEHLPYEKPVHLSQFHGFRVKTTSVEVCIAARLSCDSHESHSSHVSLQACEDRPIRIRQIIGVFTSRETPSPAEATRRFLREKRWEEFDHYLALHRRRWDSFWRAADFYLPERPDLTQALRFSLYHLRIAADHDARVSVGARALSGRAYQGHVFWDTDIFVLPFFVYTAPDIARNLLRYRYQTLAGARKRASQAGLRGAWYAWESTSSGADATPTDIFIDSTKEVIPVLSGPQQVHISADIAYAVSRYYDATRDDEFLQEFGAEVLVETARFWASRAVEESGKFHLRRVMGPDEYHFDVDDNAYTNWMARFNLEQAHWVVGWLKERGRDFWQDLARRVELGDAEVPEWKRIADRLFLPQPNSAGIIEQFAGFFRLHSPSSEKRKALGAPVTKVLQWKEMNGLRIIKQADVLMIPFLFPGAFSEEIIKANYDYYEPITEHGSSLSLAVHAAIAARLGREGEAMRYLEDNLSVDLADRMGNTALGFHAAAAGGGWQALVFHFMGVRHGASRLELSLQRKAASFPALKGSAFQLMFRGHRARFRIPRGGEK